MVITTNEARELKSALTSVLVCEIRACLYDSLSKELGGARTLYILKNAEQEALKTVKTLRLQTLLDD